VSDAWLQALAQSLGLPAMALLVVGDAFLVVIPGEAAVTTLGALAVAEGSPRSPPSSSSRRRPR
jgi:membrane protein DedA with SNARE-associated domain